MTPPVRRLLMTLDAVGGVWRYTMDLASGLQKRGTEVTFACLGPAPSPAQRAEAESMGTLVQLEAPLDWIVSESTSLQLVPHLIGDLAARIGTDLIHLNLPSQAAGLKVDVPVVVVSHSCVVTWFEAVRGTGVPPGWEWQRDLNQAGFDAADLIVAPSRSHAELLARCYVNLGTVAVVPNAVRPLAQAGVQMPFIIAAGRWWDEGKNGRTLDLAARSCHWPIRMAGSQRGPNGQFQSLAHAELLGELPSTELRRLMAEASIFVSPSIYEPFGLAPLEAASVGLPLVLADIPTYRELWDGAALFASPTKADEFTDLLNRLAASGSLRKELGARARARAIGFTIDRQVDAMASLYAAALNRRAPTNLWAVA